VARAERILKKMGENPQNDWKINDFEVVCRHYSLDCDPPTGGGSHYKVTSKYLEGILTVPAKRPIKAIYVRKFVSYVASHVSSGEEASDE
jgi:hypothetical protein